MTTGQRIKAARKKAGMTQAALAEKLDISYVNISQLEKDQRNPKLETLQRIANALEVSIYELIDGDDLKRAVIYGEGLDGGRAQVVKEDNMPVIEGSTVYAPGYIKTRPGGIHPHTWPAPQNASGETVLAERETSPGKHETVELPAPELEELLAKLQHGEPMILSPDELAKLKATPKEQVAAALDKLPSSVPAAHGTGNAFYCRPSLHPELDALFQKSQEGTITADEQERINVLMAIVQNLEGYDPSQHEFFENLRNYRDAVGLSRNKLADKTGISAAKIRDYEDRSKVAFVTDSDLYRLAHFFGVDPIKLKGRSVTQEWMTDTHSKNCLRRVNDVWDKLNTLGHEKLAERAEELVEIPRYQAQEPPEGRIQSITMICPICGQHLRGDTSTGKAYCNYCKRSFPLPQILK